MEFTKKDIDAWFETAAPAFGKLSYSESTDSDQIAAIINEHFQIDEAVSALSKLPRFKGIDLNTILMEQLGAVVNKLSNLK